MAALGNLFLQRFDPAAPLSAGPFEAACDAWEKGVEVSVQAEENRQLMRTMMRALRHTMRTNVHLAGRHALTLRLAPEYFEPVLPPFRPVPHLPPCALGPTVLLLDAQRRLGGHRHRGLRGSWVLGSG